MEVHLPKELEALVRELTESGRYGSTSDVVFEALFLLEKQERTRDAKVRQIRAMLQEGLDDIEAGRTVIFDEKLAEKIKADGREELAKRQQSRKKRA